jgi:CheY-like chemotaxis protein
MVTREEEEKERRMQRVDVQTVLLVEDFDADVFRFRCALSALNFPGKLRVAATIGQARDYLEGRGGYADRAYYGLPALIVSDLQFRGETGWQFLRWLRAHPDFSHIPVVVLSGVVEPVEHDLLVKEGAREVFEKTGDYAVMKGIVARILSHLPRQDVDASGLPLVPAAMALTTVRP